MVIVVTPSFHAGLAEIIRVAALDPCLVRISVMGDVVIFTEEGSTGRLKETDICCMGRNCIVGSFLGENEVIDAGVSFFCS